MRTLAIAGMFLATIFATHARADDFYSSLAASISHASAQARAIFSKGLYKTAVGGAAGEMSWRFSQDTDSKFEFEYQDKALISAEITFDPAVELTYRSGDFCFSVKINRIRYDESGFPIKDPSWVYKVPSDCTAPTASLVVARHVLFPVTPEKLFLARPMSGFDDIKKCTSDGSNCKRDNPIQFIKFFPRPGKPAIDVALAPSSKLMLPPDGYLLTKSARLAMTQLEYTPAEDFGEGEIKVFSADLLAGAIGSGQTLLYLASGTALEITQLKMQKNKKRITFTDGTARGALGAGSRVPLYQNAADVSYLTFTSAKANLVGLNFELENNKLTSLSIRAGDLEADISGGELLLSKGNRLLVGRTSAKIRLACPADISPCLALQSGPGGVLAFGEIGGFDSEIRGGTLTFEEGLTVALDLGRLHADLLRFDSRSSQNPITGRFETVELTLKKDAFVIAKTGVAIQAAEVRVTSNDLFFLLGDPLPIGTALIEGKADRATWFNGAEKGAEVRDAKIKLPIAREGGKPAIIGKDPANRARIEASFRGFIGPTGGGSEAKGSVVIREITGPVGGDLAGALDLTVAALEYPFDIPPGGEEGARTIEGKVVITSPVQFLDIPVKLAGGQLVIARTEQRFPFFVVVNRQQADQRAYEREMKLGPIKVCTPSMTLKGFKYSFSTKMTFALGPGTGPANRPNGFLALSDFQTPNNLEFDVDDGGCKLFVEIVCAGLGGVIPVVGSIGAFLICGKQVDDAISKLHGTIDEAWASGVAKFKLEL